jgi:hypothetical protein
MGGTAALWPLLAGALSNLTRLPRARITPKRTKLLPPTTTPAAQRGTAWLG